MVSSNYLNFSKKNDIIEIPIEIVEVAKKTTVKKAKKEEAKQKPPEVKYTPPQPISKPKPPEFVEKKKKKVKKKKKKEEEKKIEKKEKKNRLSSILKSIEKVKNEKEKIKEVEEKKDLEENQTLEENEKLTISELDMIRRQFISCWNMPAGAKNIEDLQVLVKIKLDKEGNIIDSKLIRTNNLNNPFYKAASESAMRAVRHPACKKLKVPEKKYDSWRSIELNFDPSMLAK